MQCVLDMASLRKKRVGRKHAVLNCEGTKLMHTDIGSAADHSTGLLAVTRSIHTVLASFCCLLYKRDALNDESGLPQKHACLIVTQPDAAIGCCEGDDVIQEWFGFVMPLGCAKDVRQHLLEQQPMWSALESLRAAAKITVNGDNGRHCADCTKTIHAHFA